MATSELRDRLNTMEGAKKFAYLGEEAFEDEFLCTTKSQCLRDYGKEDIRQAILKRMTDDQKYDDKGNPTGLYMKIQDDKLNKKQLVDVLMKQNKLVLRRVASYEAKGKSGSYKQAFPSKVTQPTMYDANGRLKESFLTEDHEDLTFHDDIENKDYKVVVNPITRKASWEEVRETQFGSLLKAGLQYKKDKLGRPDIRQLNYAEHHGKVVKDKNGKIHQVHCIKKKKSEPWEHPDNCQRDSNGQIKLQYGPYDPDMRKGSKLEGAAAEFVTPFGKYSYTELMKLPLDKILQMLIILELMDREDDYKTKMDKLRDAGVILPGEEKYYETYMPDMGARNVPGSDQLQKQYKKMNSEVDGADAEFQEAYFRSKGLPRCVGRRSERCYEEEYSRYPGICVKPAGKGKQSKCFKGKQDWIKAYNDSDYAKLFGSSPDYSNLSLKEAEELAKKRKEVFRKIVADPNRRSIYEGDGPTPQMAEAAKKGVAGKRGSIYTCPFHKNKNGCEVAGCVWDDVAKDCNVAPGEIFDEK